MQSEHTTQSFLCFDVIPDSVIVEGHRGIRQFPRSNGQVCVNGMRHPIRQIRTFSAHFRMANCSTAQKKRGLKTHLCRTALLMYIYVFFLLRNDNLNQSDDLSKLSQITLRITSKSCLVQTNFSKVLANEHDQMLLRNLGLQTIVEYQQQDFC